MLMLEYRYDTQLLIDGENLDEDAISDYVGSDPLRPWQS